MFVGHGGELTEHAQGPGRKDKEMPQVAVAAETVFRPKCVADIVLSIAGISSHGTEFPL